MFHQNFQFTCELEKNNQLAFLDVLLRLLGPSAVYRKPINNNINLTWTSFSTCSQKRGNLKTNIRRSYLICLTPEESDHIAQVFEKFNNYSIWVMKQLLEEIKYNNHEASHEVWEMNEANDAKKFHLLLLPYSGPKR